MLTRYRWDLIKGIFAFCVGKGYQIQKDQWLTDEWGAGAGAPFSL
jgi:hypothetical protein